MKNMNLCLMLLGLLSRRPLSSRGAGRLELRLTVRSVGLLVLVPDLIKEGETKEERRSRRGGRSGSGRWTRRR